ncbi:MAG: RHS repeat domain-containing protein, partial [Thermoguttaceae bacterium]
VSTGLTTTYLYDNMNRLVKLSNFRDDNNNGVMDAGEGVSQFDYLLDAKGNKTHATEKFWTEYGLQKNEIDWAYDDLSRMVKEKFDHYNDEFDQTSEWVYDLVGNRLRQTIDKGNDGSIDETTNYSYDSNDRLTLETSGSKQTQYGYDHTQQTGKIVTENGVLVSETVFEYDAQGRMAVVTTITGNKTDIVKYFYGADGIRVASEQETWSDGLLVTKTRTEHVNDSRSITGYSQVLKQTDFDAEGNVTKTVSYAIGHQRISQTVTDANSNQQEYFFTFDGHGSTRVLLDATAAAVQLYSFDAYGNALGFNPAEALTEFLYSGEQFDSKIGQQYLRARYYDPSTGIFNRLDPFFGNLSDPQSLHKYAYVHGNPVMGIDPSGMMTMGSMMCSMSIGGALIGGSFGAYRDGLQGALVGAFAGGVSGAAVALASPALAGFFGTGFWGGIGFGMSVGGLGGAVNGGIYGTLLKNGEFGFHLRHGFGMALIEGGMGAIAGGVFAGVVPLAGIIAGRVARPIGIASQQLKDSMMGIAKSPAFQSRVEYWIKLTGRPSINWNKFIDKLDDAIFQIHDGPGYKAWAGLDETGEKLFFSVSKHTGLQGQSHELFHGAQEFMEPGLMLAAQQGNLGPFSIAAIEASANLYGSPGIGLTATGVGAIVTYRYAFPTASTMLDYFMLLGEFDK